MHSGAAPWHDSLTDGRLCCCRRSRALHLYSRFPCFRFVEEWFGQKKNAEIADLKDRIQELEQSLKMAQEEITILRMPPEADEGN